MSRWLGPPHSQIWMTAFALPGFAAGAAAAPWASCEAPTARPVAPSTPRRMAFTTNYKEEEVPALRFTLDFAATFDATIHVINVDITHTHLYHKRMETMKEKFAHEQKVKFHILEGDDLIQTIYEYLEEHSIDMVVMLSYKRNFLEELFHYSLAKKMAYHGRTPILALPAQMFEA